MLKELERTIIPNNGIPSLLIESDENGVCIRDVCDGQCVILSETEFKGLISLAPKILGGRIKC